MPFIPFTVYGPAQGYFISFLHDSRTLDYTVGHSGVLDVPDGRADPERVLSRIFAEGNGHGDGPGFTVGRRSMSSGDVVHLEGLGVWLCASVGWTRLEGADAARFPLLAMA
ncbi:MAG TPA: hypothetical protein VF006_28605 [Longimicrobium sp.]